MLSRSWILRMASPNNGAMETNSTFAEVTVSGCSIELVEISRSISFPQSAISAPRVRTRSASRSGGETDLHHNELRRLGCVQVYLALAVDLGGVAGAELLIAQLERAIDHVE